MLRYYFHTDPVAKRLWRYHYACLVYDCCINRHTVLTRSFKEVTKLLVFFWICAKINKPCQLLPCRLVCLLKLWTPAPVLAI
jgi:hypothetical protein